MSTQTAPLESRVLLASVSPAEQLFLELVNRARANPSAEASRYGINLNEGLPAGTISTSASQPLAQSDALQAAIQGHLKDMLAKDYFSHRGSDGSTFVTRITKAGYKDYTLIGESLAYLLMSGSRTLEQTVNDIHQALFVDKGVSGRSHRKDMLNPTFKEVGSGILTGDYKGKQALFAGNDFGAKTGNSYLTGVAFSDAVKTDNFYSIGEGLGGVTVTVRDGNRTVGTTTTNSAGGYDIQLPAGKYTVTFSGNGLRYPVTKSAVISNQNVKVDANAKRDSVALPTVQFSASTYSVNESARSRAVTVTLSRAATSPTVVDYWVTNGTAAAGRDFTSITGTLIFAAGEKSKTLNITILEDTLDEPDETVNLRLTAPIGLTLGTARTAVLTIVDNDVASRLSTPVSQQVQHPTLGVGARNFFSPDDLMF